MIKSKAMDQYCWERKDGYFGEFKEGVEWMSESLFDTMKDEDKRNLKYLTRGRDSNKYLTRGRDSNTASHYISAAVFPPQPYIRPFKLEKVSSIDEEDTITTVQKKKFIHPYEGKVDAELSLTYAGGMDSEGRGSVYFSNGELKAGMVPDPESFNYMPISSAKEYKNFLNSYFKIDDFGDNLSDIINNSNLPDEIKERFRELGD